MLLAENLKKNVAWILVGILFLASVAPLFTNRKVNAYNLPTSREIKMSSSVNGATDVTYAVSFNAATTSTVQGLVVDFCSNSPIIGDACTAPSGFDINEGGLALANAVGITSLTLNAATTANKLVLTNATGNAITAADPIAVELGAGGPTDGVTNPTTTNTTFYARIFTYATVAGATGYTSASVGTPLDAGGVALSTAAQITITSKVQERLTFCIYTSAANYTNCTAVSGTTVTLGDTTGVLSDSGAFVDITTKYNVSTNASNGVTIRAKGATLTSGSNTITGMGATANTSTPGSEEFGFCTYQDPGGSSGLTPATPYNNGACNTTTQTAGTGTPGGEGTANFAFDVTTGGNNLSTTYGNTIASKTAGAQSTGIIAFIGNTATVTEPGIYTSTLTFIATGNY